jgi:ABC-type multidrug transport system fused ATPase/permease subunit
MKHEMNIDKRILLILATLVVTALLATFWATREPIGSPPEFQGLERWNLTNKQRQEIDQLIRDMRANRASWEEIKAAVDAKLDEWSIQQPPRGDIELFYTAKTVISTVNMTLVTILMLMYIAIYRKTKSEFTVGLMIFSMILLLYTLASNPIMHWFFGFRAFGLGPFAMLPDLFACVALAVLLYLTVKY